MDVNVKGTFLYLKNIIPEMENMTGLIINISSGAGKEGIPELAAYCASKFAVIGLTESAAAEVKNVKIVENKGITLAGRPYSTLHKRGRG